MSPLERFVDRFVLPLLGGGEVHVAGPIGAREFAALAGDAGALGSADLRIARLRRAALLVADPPLPDPDRDDLELWVGLHNLLALDHPERRLAWSTRRAWQRVELDVRTRLARGAPSDVGEQLARHVSVGAFVELVRIDALIVTPSGEQRLRGQIPRPSLFGSRGPRSPERTTQVRWIAQPHQAGVDELIVAALRASPLTATLEPGLAPPDATALAVVECLRERGLARAIVHRWARGLRWIDDGAALTAGLLRSIGLASAEPPTVPAKPGTVALPAASGATPPPTGPLALPGEVVAQDPASIGAVLAALIHVHLLRVLDLDARVGAASGSRAPGVQAFLALPLLLPWIGGVVGDPLGDLPDAGDPLALRVRRRWAEYLQHLEDVVPSGVRENLVATLVPRVVQPA